MKKMITVFCMAALTLFGALMLGGCSEQTYSIVYEAGNGSVRVASREVSYGKGFFLDVPYLQGAAFAGWYDSADKDSVQITDNYGKSIGKYETKGDSVVYAKWNLFDTLGLVYNLLEDESGYAVSAPEEFSGELLKIPETYEGKTVLQVGAFGFSDCQNLKMAVLPDSIVSIGRSAFSGCENMTSFTNSESVKDIGERAFYRCYNLLSFDFNAGLAHVGISAFMDCRTLGAVDLSAAAENFTLDERSFSGCSALSDLKLPQALTAIPEYAFAACAALTEIVVGDAVDKVETGAFSGCAQVRSVHIGKNMRYLGELAFNGCTYLSAITVDGENKYFSAADNVLFNRERSILYRYAPYQEGTSYTLPGSVVEIDAGAFNASEYLLSVAVGKNVRRIRKGAFAGMIRVAEMTVPFVGESLIGNQYFAYIFGGEHASMTTGIPYTLRKVNVTGGEVIGENAFQFCSALTEINMPDGIRTISQYAFYGCSSLKRAFLPDGVRTVGNNAFLGCARLEEVFLNENLAGIGDNAFSVCGVLKKIYVGAKVPSALGENAFYGTNEDMQIVFESQIHMTTYAADLRWAQYADHFTVE